MILEAAILTTVVVLSLTVYTFWAAKKGYDFNFLGPFLFGALIVLMVFALIQVPVPYNCLFWFNIRNSGLKLSLIVVLWVLFVFLQIFFPLGRISVMIYGCLAAIIFCGYIVYDTDNLIKRYSYDEYIWAAVSLYLDIINLFLALLTIFRAAE